MSTYPPRPTWNHPDTKALAALEIQDAVHNWTQEAGMDLPNDQEILAAMTLAMIESPDAYWTCRYIEEVFRWPVDAVLVGIFDSGFRRLKFLKTQLVHEWVTKNGVRFPAKKGQGVVARIGDAEIRVRIEDVLAREAAAYGEPISRPGQKVRVHAEEVLKVIPLTPSRGPDNSPTGGTPAAMQKQKVA